MSSIEIIEAIFACGLVGRAVVCAPLIVGCIAGYVGLGKMAEADNNAAKASRNTRYN